MTTLSDTQLVILSSAAQRDDGAVVLPERLRGQAARNSVRRLLANGLLEEVMSEGELPVWRSGEQDAYALRVTSAGLASIGIDPEGNGRGTSTAVSAPSPDDAPSEKITPTAAESRPLGGKLALIVSLLSRDVGASIADLTLATGWLPHTARAALSGLRRKGYALTSSKEQGESRCYRISAASPASSETDQA